MSWLFLCIAICAEVFATSMLKYAQEFTRLWPSLGVIIGYSISFYMLTLSLRTIPVGITYAVWAGLGIVLMALIGWLFLGEKLDTAAIIGMILIISGVLVMNLFSATVSH